MAKDKKRLEGTIKNMENISKYECELQALICEREAYIAANRERISNGYALAYDDRAFFELAEEFRKLYKQIT